MPYDILQHGPYYDIESATLQKWRRLAAKRELDRDEKRAYGEAVEKAVKAKQRSKLQRELPSWRVNCASGTDYPDGERIHEAVRKQQENALLAYPAKVRRERHPDDWKQMYDAAMREKRARCK